MLLIATRSKWLIASFMADTLLHFLQYVCITVILSIFACYIWILAFLIDILLMGFLRGGHKVKQHELPHFSFEGCPYEPYVNTIRENIAVYLASDVITAEMTADSLDGLLPANQYLRYPDAFVSSSVHFAWRMWETIVHFAFQIPHDHASQEKLVKLIVALSKRPAVLVRYENTLLRFWDAMPHYDNFIAVYGNMFFFDYEWSHTNDKIHQTNLMAFLARVQATGLPHGLMFGMKWSLHTALDEERLDVLLWATLWIEHCGEYLWWFVSQESNNGVILNKQNWTHYMRRFGEVACDGQNGRYVRLLAQDAFRTMVRLTVSAPNPKFDSIGQMRWETLLAQEGSQGVFAEPIAPDLWVEEEEEEEEEEEVYWYWNGEGYVPRNSLGNASGFHPLRPPGGFLMYSNMTEEDESVIARAA
ncbi:hypothetical protein N0V93_006476 [Gnomoniopsis smithogilvyi]|uniref:Uncharacterized protein n=1 Tax=Gnomoniopsis smithogilvyi TaxID=1191159 RepID=A0A9W9CUS0_9PEZI|nr:hypothetical protein N0V93_006476 [Gnomoniopsis smithogilvyi]